MGRSCSGGRSPRLEVVSVVTSLSLATWAFLLVWAQQTGSSDLMAGEVCAERMDIRVFLRWTHQATAHPPKSIGRREKSEIE